MLPSAFRELFRPLYRGARLVAIASDSRSFRLLRSLAGRRPEELPRVRRDKVEVRPDPSHRAAVVGLREPG